MRLIDADDLMDWSETVPLTGDGGIDINDFEEKLKSMPTIEAEPVRHGKWITEECLPGVAVCSICGHEIRGIGCQYTKYCDECGARMDEE